MKQAQKSVLQTLANGMQETADQIETIGARGVEIREFLNCQFPEQSPEIVQLVSGMDRLGKALVVAMHQMRTVSALAQESATGE
ncbi:hypothetical protein Q31b_42390 [Novipirellula aureliae]|uniref:Uncharacterized protein n=1 Tax=Novipirellula aureliae TaxID=2527966 RepID=A0A5C6DSH5_9BACT|nr:hypothetical protein [Novipirellula aureliae]TWU39154.1 hypothetical protein Q31b_42390 [Novipirellula aureliae]